jgi:predicted nucleic acid-binding protein
LRFQFVDSSAFAKLFIAEAGSADLQAYLHDCPDDATAISVIAYLEVHSALQRRLRSAQLTELAVSQASMDLEAPTHHFERIPVEPPLIDLAAGLIKTHSLRAMDALQLASAVGIYERLRPGEELLFIACDERLLESAGREGLLIWNPALASAPPAPIPPVN